MYSQTCLYSYDLGLFCRPNFFELINLFKKEKEKKKDQKYFSTRFVVHLFASQEYAQLWGFGGVCASLATSHCHSVSFCTARDPARSRFYYRLITTS